MDERSWAEMKAADPEKLEAHLKKIVGERTPHLSDGHLHDVFQYIKKTLEHLEYEIELDPFLFEGETYENIIARKRGVRSSGRIIVGAHFDSVPGSPGADDNASGVAVLLELARILNDRKWNHTVEFIGFHMEEWYMVGSKAYVEKLEQGKVNVRGMVQPPVYRPGRPIPLSEEKQVVGMVSLEMVGFTSEERGSQKMPPGFGFFYPSTGNFIGIVGNVRSWGFLRLFKTEMKKTDGLPVRSLIMPFNGALLYPTRWSDHSPFWDAGYPALMITDTSFYRNPHYHGPNDTVETLNLDFIQKVTEGTAQALVALDEG